MAKLKFKKEKDKEKKQIEVEDGVNLREAMMAAGIDPYPDDMSRRLNCGGKGRCGTCRVHIEEGMENASEKTWVEKWRIRLSWFAIGVEDKVRLSCQTKVLGDMTIDERPDFNWSGEDRRVVNNRAGNVDEVIFE